MRASCSWILRLLSVAVMILALTALDGREKASSDAHADNISRTQPVEWRDTGVTIEEENYHTCFDGKNPNVLYVSNDLDSIGTVAYDLTSGKRQIISPLHYQICAKNGYLYANDSPRQQGGTEWRYNLQHPDGERLPIEPTLVAEDGSQQVYSFGRELVLGIMSSTDAGLTWENRGAQFGDRLLDVTMSWVDSQSLYGLVADNELPGDYEKYMAADFSLHIYYSSDGGMSWQERGHLVAHSLLSGAGHEYISINSPNSNVTPVNTLFVGIEKIYSASNAGVTDQTLLSVDGARTFVDQGILRRDGGVTQLFYHSNEGILRLTNGYAMSNPILELTTDGGNSWDELLLPTVNETPFRSYPSIYVVPEAPSHVFAWKSNTSQGQDLYLSTDGGHSWVQVYGPDLTFNPYLLRPNFPLSFVVIDENHVYDVSLPFAGQGLLERVVPNDTQESTYFSETGHNLSGSFREYWEANGGLAQFGYPLTDPFSEVSDVDKRAYQTQYFERAVFELHPENQPPYNVLLSLIGANAYEQKYGGAGAPDQHASRDYPLYFPETGHTIGGKFRQYWESHGGLAQQGYPISDEFTEISPVDNKPYTVQYFQRSRFELHPENAGTPYEVLLGQLGAAQFKSRFETGAVEN